MVRGEPVPRSEGVFRGRIYDRRKRAKKRIKSAIFQYSKKIPDLLDCALRVQVLYFLRIPKGTPKALRLKMLRGEVRPTKKPDLTNLTKLIEDCCTGLVWRDDSLIVSETTDKYWGDRPRTVIKIEPFIPDQLELLD